MSVGIFALKVGLVTTVAGTAVATPILLRNRRSLVTEVAQSAEVNNVSLGSSAEANTIPQSTSTELGRTDLSSEIESRIEEQQRASEATVDSREPDSEQETRQTEREEVGEDSPANTDDLSQTGSTISPQESVASEAPSSAPVVKKEEFSKKCFVVPAEFSGKDGVQLLTCYDEHKLREEVDEDQPEYDSEFHIYDQSRKENPIEIKGSLQWTPANKQLVAKLNNSDTTYTFTATGNHWDGISPSNKPINLAGLKECAIYEAKLNDSTEDSTYWLVCGGDVDTFSSAVPTGAPLVNWSSRR